MLQAGTTRENARAQAPSPHPGGTLALRDHAVQVAVPLDREASGTIHGPDAPRTSVTIGTVDVHVAPPPQPAAPPPRAPARAAASRRSAVETRFLDRFLLGG
jgi:hypothetical protein